MRCNSPPVARSRLAVYAASQHWAAGHTPQAALPHAKASCTEEECTGSSTRRRSGTSRQKTPAAGHWRAAAGRGLLSTQPKHQVWICGRCEARVRRNGVGALCQWLIPSFTYSMSHDSKGRAVVLLRAALPHLNTCGHFALAHNAPPGMWVVLGGHCCT